MTEEEKIICKQFLNDADKTHSCNEYKLFMALLDQKTTTKNDLEVDAISRSDVLKLMQDNWHTHNGDWAMQESMDDIRALPSVTPQEPRKGYLSIDDVMSVFDDFMCGEVDEDGTETFLEMLIDKAESEK